MLKMNTTKRYDKYKDSGIEWIGEIPDSWNINKIGQIYQERNEKVSDKEFMPLSVTKNGIVPQLENAAKTDNGDNRKLVRQNDFVINSRSDRRGSCGISDYTGSVSLINTVLTPRKNMINQYYNFTFKSECFADEFYRWGTGIVDDLWSTKWSSMKNIYVPYPNIKEQEAMAGYLDKKCGAIDETIEKQKSVIEKLKEYKQSIITQAVTKSLDKSAPMKDSGIEWIGQIPQHWEVEKLKTLFNFGKGLSITKDNLTEMGIPVISYGQIHSKSNTGTQISDELIRYVPETYLENNIQSLVNRGDFIFADTSEDIEGAGNCVFVDKQLTLFAGYHSIILKNKEHDYNLGKYLSYLFQADLWRIQVRANVSGIKVYSISQKILKQITALVPSKNEQKQIAEFLDKKCSEIDKTIEDKEKLIEKLVEYKKSLIYECVTGKRRVI